MLRRTMLKLAAVTLGLPTVAQAQIDDEALLGRAEPPFIPATIQISKFNIQHARWDVFSRALELLAQQSKMNNRLLMMKVNQKWCEITKQPRPAITPLLKLFPDPFEKDPRKSFIEIGVTEKGDITFKAINKRNRGTQK